MLQFGNAYRMEVAMAQPRQVMAARRALDVLGAFSAERPEWSVTEMSQHLGVHKSTMSRLLTTMEAAGFVRRAPNNGHYALGPRLLELSALALSRLDVRPGARPWPGGVNPAAPGAHDPPARRSLRAAADDRGPRHRAAYGDSARLGVD